MSDVCRWYKETKKEHEIVYKHRSENRIASVKALNIIAELDNIIAIWDKLLTEDDNIYLGQLYMEMLILKDLLVDFDKSRYVLEKQVEIGGRV